MEKIALILAGGKGTRLWPLSRENYPKQFVEFKDGLSLFQLTLKRISECFPPENIFIVSQDNYKFTLHNQIEFLPGLSNRIAASLKRNLIFEPASKNTLPAVLLSIKFIEQAQDSSPRLRQAQNDSGLIYVFPSDHIIEPVSAFKKYIKQADALADKNKLVVFGVEPNSPKQGYGYVLTKNKFHTGFLVDKFVEKPSLNKAKALLNKGAFWNAGIFCFNKGTFLRELAVFQPQIYRRYNFPYQRFKREFKTLPNISLDYGIMQKTKNAALVKFDLKWSDLGSWDSYLQFHSDTKRNFKIGKAEFINSKNCFTLSRNRLICVLGLNDVIAIDSSDALLLIKKGSTDNVKELVSIIDKKGYLHSKDGATVYRPWGYYTVVYEAKNYKVKEIGIYPKKSLSLQRHKYRSEHWNIVEGEVGVLLEDKEKQARKNESVFVPQAAKHRIYNPTNRLAKIIEVQIGSYVGEDDIKRFSKYK